MYRPYPNTTKHNTAWPTYIFHHGSLDRYVKLRFAHAPWMPGSISPPLRVSDPDLHYGTCVTYVPWCIPGSLTSGFLWKWWRGKRSQHSWRMRKPQICVSFKRPIMMSSNGNIFRVTGPSLGIPPIIGVISSQRPVTRNFEVFCDLRRNKRLSKRSRRRQFETPSRS